jgi:ABC-type transport system involved in cytochrome bd biosynthesis fused ATPase/permease subunit
MFIAALLGGAAFIGGAGLTISSGWLITIASEHPPIMTLGVSIVLVRFFGIFRSVARYLERIVSHSAVFARLTSLRVELFSSLDRRGLSAARDINSGTFVKALVDDVERGQEYQLRVVLPSLAAILSVGAGVVHSAAVSSTGACYTWGGGIRGQLGHGRFEESLLPEEVVLSGFDTKEAKQVLLVY